MYNQLTYAWTYAQTFRIQILIQLWSLVSAAKIYGSVQNKKYNNLRKHPSKIVTVIEIYRQKLIKCDKTHLFLNLYFVCSVCPEYFLPSRLVQMLTVNPDRLEGSVMSGKSRFLKLKRSSTPGRIPMLGVLMVSLISMSSCVLAMWYVWENCSGWYLWTLFYTSGLWIGQL